ncbi:hypothetical protein [Ammoniphilus sp. CFH 90114]|uniref:hypothetical protein n=1 Tax=Ammoniphilus sp. CFH 90114 TaxID=2493665 RepID=UPI00100F2D64|nr:hypothetical protein [Ammoniphilus sp. CFH 90114]RXT08053.1 hypothetical protein EIZ39_11625 [Ammoniphilus sp. CFH 90114]
MNNNQIREFLTDKNWVEPHHDSRFIHPHHPYVIINAGDEGQVTLRETSDHGQNGEEIFTFYSLDQLQGWFENNIGE